ncbi:zinc/iron regulated transporter-related protein 88E [Megachile rotundata]|uniref:zinc/iron regulated transporter-related protein 88E n=1 Tax=Megachile rotundata TaxID=143995 RepID=UPI000614F21E|nr:PREDICTED: zinc transporter ZIP3 [Megachile rotundata]
MITAVQAKLASMIAIGAGSFIVGVAPSCFVSRVRYLQQKLLLSCTLCFGGGVLLATAILHMLPEIRESMPDYAELLFSCGFLLLYLIDETVHYFWNTDDQRVQQSNSRPCDWSTASQVERCRNHSHQIGPTTSNRPVRSVSIFDVNPKAPYRQSVLGNGTSSAYSKSSTYGAVQYGPSAPTFNNEETFLCHGTHSEPCANNTNTNLMGLLLALTVHAVLEGLAVGLQKVVSEVFLLVGAVASHKFVVGFCLGLELAGANNSLLRIISAIFVFSAGSAVGIGIGMLTFKMDNKWTNIVLPILQGLAGGTLLYGTVSEILPRERARWHNSERRCAGILQFFSVILGFVLIYVLNNYVGS